jgi:NAD(P)-dependent dehydrogenase (short-subunit alcohol dehydrogenase family)
MHPTQPDTYSDSTISGNGRRLQGRRLLITGGASGIGLAAARLFLAEGGRVALVDRDASALERAGAELGCTTVVADVTDEAEVQRAVETAIEKLGGLNGLVNAAGISFWRSFEDLTFSQWRQVMSVNLDGPFLVCKAAWEALKTERGSTIVNVASGAGLQPRLNFSAYCSSKAGLILFTKSLALDGAHAHIRANAICPGIVLTPLVEKNLQLTGDREAAFQRYISRNVMHRFGAPEEVAQSILFLSCGESSFITGSALSLDGGSVFH